MEFNISKECISLCDTTPQGSGEHTIDCDITLPEYLPDIVRILRCTANSGVISHTVTGDRVTAEVTALVRVLYICNEGKLHCFEQRLQFAKQLEINPADGITLCVGAKTEYINYRVAGQRRIEMHGAVSVFAKSTVKKNCDIVSACKGGGMASKCQEIAICTLKSVTEKIFSVNETVEVTVTNAPIQALIYSVGTATIDEIKVISDKLFLKGRVILHSTFICEGNEVHNLESIININQIIEADNLDEAQELNADFKVSLIDARPRFEMSANKNYLDVTACLCFSAQGYTQCKIPAVCDAYSTQYECNLSRSTAYLPQIQEKINNTILCRDTCDLESTGVSEVLCFNPTSTTAIFSNTNEGFKVAGEVTAEFIYRDRQGEISFAQRLIPYEYKGQIDCDSPLICNPKTDITAYNFVIGGDSRIDVRIELLITGFVFSESAHQIVNEIELKTDCAKKNSNAPLTIYFADGGESVWDIARRYCTTAEVIKKDNNLTTDRLEKACKLIISAS